MNGLELYNKVRTVPAEAKKEINAGRLKGMTDINPMWRIKVLTEQFGPCGLGWYYEITEQKIEEGSEGQKIAFTNINLFVKYGNEWSKPIQGTGGSSFIAKESKGPYTSDECFKMALTDALSVACKALGIGADVYFAKDRSKYDSTQDQGKVDLVGGAKLDKAKIEALKQRAAEKKVGLDYICGVKKVNSVEELTFEMWQSAMAWLEKK